jgi:hypothetical protein
MVAAICRGLNFVHVVITLTIAGDEENGRGMVRTQHATRITRMLATSLVPTGDWNVNAFVIHELSICGYFAREYREGGSCGHLNMRVAMLLQSGRAGSFK